MPQVTPTSALVEALESEALKVSSDPNATPRDVRCAFRLALQARNMLFKQQYINVRRQKIAQLERRENAAKAAVHNSRLSEEETAERIRQIFKLSA